MQAILYAAQAMAKTDCSADPARLGRGMAMAIALELLSDAAQFTQRGASLREYAERMARNARGFADLFATYVTKMRIYLPILGAVGAAVKQVDLTGLPIPEELRPAVEESMKALLEVARKAPQPSKEELCSKARYVATVIGYGRFDEVEKALG